MSTAQRKRITAIKKALADYVSSEGCSCCRDTDAHVAAANQLGRLLRFPKYSDGSGYSLRMPVKRNMPAPGLRIGAKRKARNG